MDNFDLKKFLTENKLTSVTRLSETADVPRQALAELLKVLEQYETMSSSPEEGDWREDPTHVLEMGIEILEKYGVQVPDGMFSDRLYDRVVSMAARPDNEYEDDLPGIADDILTLLQDPNMYNLKESRLKEAGPIPPMPKDFLHGDTITFKYDGFERVPHVDDGGFVTYVSTERIGGYNLVIELGGDVTTDSQGNLVDFDYNFDYDENLKISIVTAGLHKEGRVVRKKVPVKQDNTK